MNMEGVTVDERPAKGPMGFRFKRFMVTIPNGCPTCKGRGIITYVTKQDSQAWESRSHCCCDDYGPHATGKKKCKECKGKGRIKGARPLIIDDLELGMRIKIDKAIAQSVADMLKDMEIKAQRSFDDLINRIGP